MLCHPDVESVADNEVSLLAFRKSREDHLLLVEGVGELDLRRLADFSVLNTSDAIAPNGEKNGQSRA